MSTSYSVDCTEHSTAQAFLRDWRTTDLAQAKVKCEEYADRGAVGVSGFDDDGECVFSEVYDEKTGRWRA